MFSISIMALKGVTSREQGLLEAAGLWDKFRAYRRKIVAGGKPSQKASIIALADWMPDLQNPREPDPALLKCLPHWIDPIESKSSASTALPLAPVALAGKTAAEPEVARWVSRNIDNPSPDPKTCPDPFAWTLLRMCREDTSFAMMFIKDIWTKLLVAQARQGDDGAEEAMDGTPTLELISRIRVISDKTKHSGVEQLAARVAHNHEVGGSNPSPVIPSFEDATDFGGEDA